MSLKNFITPNTCKSTQGGWIWYCDSCITHGNANSSDEAEHMAEAHALYFSWDESQEYDEESDGENITNYMDIAPEHREDTIGVWSMECLQATYLISVSDNITYEYGADYSDKTIEPIDLDVALEVQKRMGLE